MNTKNFKKDNLNRAKQAQERGITYSLKPLSLRNIYRAKRCHYLNIVLNVRSEKFKSHTRTTVDRVNSSRGYIKGNVVAASNIANQLKGLVESGLICPDDIINMGKKLKSIK